MEASVGREPVDSRKGTIMTSSCGEPRKTWGHTPEFILSLALACSGLNAQTPQVQTFPLSGVQDLDARNVKMEPAEYRGRKAVRITFPDSPAPGPRFTFVRGVDFADGTIEADVAAKMTLTAPAGAPPLTAFIGIAFRTRPDANHYELFYLRPGNSRSSDQAQRNHSVQYMSMPDFDWSKLRWRWPSIYEVYADQEPEAWTKMKIEVAGRQARLYINSAPRPALVVDGLKGEDLRGGIGLWAGGGQDSYFSNLRITHTKPQPIENGSDATGTWDIKYGIGRFAGVLKLHRDGSVVTGTASGLLGTDDPVEVDGIVRRSTEVPVTGTWRNGYLEISFQGDWGKSGAVTVDLAGWIDGNSAKGRLALVGRADGAWAATKRE